MPNYNDIEKEILTKKLLVQDDVRHCYMEKLAEYTKCDIVSYIACTNRLPNQAYQHTGINNEDITSLMTALSGLNSKDKSLILIIHSLGGSLEATEQIVSYLRSKYQKITAIIPQMAMSAATLLTCACDEIIMGKQSAIGPIDPQYNGIPAQAILQEFKKASEDISKNPGTIPLWLEKMRSLPVGMITMCEEASVLSKKKAEDWLSSYMFKGDKKGKEKAAKVANWLGDFQNHKTHSHPISMSEAVSKGLKIKALEDDQEMQDIVLSIFHAAMITFSTTSCIKIIENHNGVGRYLRFNISQSTKQ